MTATKNHVLYTRVTADEHEQLRALALRNERTPAQEVRLAIRERIEREGK